MTETHTVPTITNAATKAKNPRKLFVNILISDLQRSIVFFEKLGFSFNTQFTDHTATAMLVGEDAYFMLLTPGKFAQFTTRPLGDVAASTSAIYALGVNSKEEVDAMVNAAVAAGGSHAMPPQDHGFMYGWSFYDLDGHHWEVFYMDPSFVQG